MKLRGFICFSGKGLCVQGGRDGGGFLMLSSFGFTFLKVTEVNCQVEEGTEKSVSLWYRYINFNFHRDFEPCFKSVLLWNPRLSTATEIISIVNTTFWSFIQLLLMTGWQSVCIYSERIDMLMESVEPQLRQYSKNILGIFTTCLICHFVIFQAQTSYWAKQTLGLMYYKQSFSSYVICK